MTVPATVSIALRSSSEDADAALRRHVAEVLDADPSAVRVGRLCPACGSSAHGRPWARLDARFDAWPDARSEAWPDAGRTPDGSGSSDGSGRADVAVSLSRSGPHLVTAVSLDGPIGVDIESISAVDGRWDPALVLAPGEETLAAAPEGRARLWAGKEAVLKLLGTGLRTPMPLIVLAEHQVRAFPAPAGYVAAVALAVGPCPALAVGPDTTVAAGAGPAASLTDG